MSNAHPNPGEPRVTARMPSAGERSGFEARVQEFARSWHREHALFALFLALTAAAVLLAYFQARNVPYWDEWENVPYVAGKRAITAEWLWSLHAEHRFLLPRLLYLGVMRVAGNDFRAMTYVNAALLAFAAFALLVAARRARGSWRWGDATIPIVLLNWGQAENMLWGFQVSFTLFAALSCWLMAAVMACTRPLRGSSVIAVVVPLLLLPLVGATGFALALGFAPWLLAVAFMGWRSRSERTAGVVAFIGASALAALLIAYALGTQEMRPATPPETGVTGSVWRALMFLSGGMGPIASAWHPLLTSATALLLAATATALTRGAIIDRDRRPIEAGFLCLLIGVSLLAAVVVWGRSPRSPDEAFVARYVTLAAPMWCLFHLAWSRAGTGWSARFVSPAIALVALCAMPWNTSMGLTLCADRSQRLHAFEMDAWSGISVLDLASRHAGFVYPGDRNSVGSELRLAEHIAILQRARLGPFALDPAQRWKALHDDCIRFLLAHQSHPWIPVLLDEEQDRAHFVLLSPAPGRISLRVPAGSWTLSGSVGLRRDAWEMGRSDGVVFAVEVRIPARPRDDRRVFERWVRPVEQPSDRGPQHFETRIETESAADIMLLTDPGPAHDSSFDSSYWGDLSLVPAS
jgi:hypothetical protein